MPKGQLTINGIDAFEAYGMSLSNGALSALITPAANKEYIQNSSRIEHGIRIINNNPKQEARDVTLPFHITAHTESAFFARYEALCEVLSAGNLEIWCSFYPTKKFRMIYRSCTQFGEYHQRLAKFTLKLTEPDPTNRSL